jgi:hypothetical protein
MIVHALDPGPHSTALVSIVAETGEIINRMYRPNDEILKVVSCVCSDEPVVCEWIEAYGMAVGRDVFETCFWSGRFAQETLADFYRIGRKQVKLVLCGSHRAKDKNIRQACIDRFQPEGGGSIRQIGTKKAPGPLYGVSSHLWSALAVGLAWIEIEIGVRHYIKAKRFINA